MSPEGGGDRCPLVEETAGDDEEPFALSLLRSSCDGCWRKKCKCSGEMPCSRCRRSGAHCTYSTKRRLGRPRGPASVAKLQLAQQQQGQRGVSGREKGGASDGSGVGGAGTSNGDENDVSGTALFSTPFAASPVTGLGGLPESRFLSAFLEHFTPMFPVANEVSIRDGLMHSFAGMWYGGPPALHGEEAVRGRALECSFFSSVVIGGLLSGQAPESVGNHVRSSRTSVVEFRGLSDRHAVSALVLSGMMNLLLPGRESRDAGRRSLDDAEEVFESLPEKDPLVGVILTFRRQVEGLALLDAGSVCPPPPPPRPPPPRSPRASTPTSKASTPAALKKGTGKRKAGQTEQPRASSPSAAFQPKPTLPPGSSGGGGKGESGGGGGGGGGDVDAHTAEAKAIMAGLDGGRGDGKDAPLTQPAHAAFVVADALLLSVRFMRGGGPGGISRLRYVHDYVASELNRLVPGKAGALVLISLAGILLAVKTRLQLTDGMLPMAELITVMLNKCPGWGRSYGRHAAHLSLAVFRLHRHREAYNTLRSLIRRTSDDAFPDFDDEVGEARQHACGLGVCEALSASLLALNLPGDGGDVARGGTGGGSSNSIRGGGGFAKGGRKNSRKRPAPAAPAAGGGRGGGGGTKRQRPRSPRSASVSAGTSAPASSAVDEAEAKVAGASDSPVPAPRFHRRRTSAAGSDFSPAAVVAVAPAAAPPPRPAAGYGAPLRGVTAPSGGEPFPPDVFNSADVAAAAAAVASATASAVAAAAASTPPTSPSTSDRSDLRAAAP
ncbi:unnamed protein product, partial [Scytosiphon promiscuus]